MALEQIVVIEDEAPIREAVVEILRNAGFSPIPAEDGEAGLAAARRLGVSLVLLDLFLPKLSGMEVLARLRKTHPTLPVIILTARGGEEDRVAGLRGGADDYVVKPFSARELLARVEAVLRRSPERPGVVQSLEGGGVTIDLERREVRGASGRAEPLSETESTLLAHLAAHETRAISRQELLTRLWGVTGRAETRTIDMHVARLRAKLSGCGSEDGERYIATVRGKGYMLGSGLRSVACVEDTRENET